MFPRGTTGRRRRLLLALVVVAVLLVGGVTAVVLVVVREPDSATARLRDAVAGLRSVDAVRVLVNAGDGGGRTITAELTVTADGYASGVVADSYGGRADVVIGAGSTAVRGDADWWARRSPKQVRALTGRWVRPEPGVALPFDVVGVLGPAAVVALVDSLADRASADGEATEVMDGRRVRTVVSGGWTALIGADGREELVWLGGPLDPATVFRPAALGAGVGDGGVAGVAPARWLPQRRDPVAVPPYVTMMPVPADAEAASGTRLAVARVLPEAKAAVTADSAPVGEVASPPPQRTVKPGFAKFDVTVNATDCATPMCTWTVSVTNSGTADGEGILYAQAIPGMAEVSFPVRLPVGGVYRTPPMPFANPAPEVRGRRTQVPVVYRAWLYNPSFGADPALPTRLMSRGINPNKDLVPIDPGYMPTVLTLLDQMTRHAPVDDPRTTERAIDAINQAITFGVLPELKTIADSGRLDNPKELINKLIAIDVERVPSATDDVNATIGYRREVEQAAEILRHDPTARLLLDGAIRDPATGELHGADILDTTNKTAYQLKSVGNSAMVGAINVAVGQLNGLGGQDAKSGIRQQAPSGYERIALIYLEPRSGKFHQYNESDWIRYLRQVGVDLKICDGDGQARLERLVIVNARGVFTWRRGGFDAIGKPC